MSLINITDLTFAYDGSYDTIFDHVSFQIDTDWKLGFTGRNGRGKTTFLQLLMGMYEYSGKISASVRFDYFPYPIKDRQVDALRIADEILGAYEDWELMRELSLLGVSAEVLYRPFSTLSNGEQTKVLLAILFLKENSFLLIDEPTNHLDMEGRALVGKYLRSKQGFILVSHDRVFLDSCADHILSINKTNIEIQSGSFSSWWQNKERADHYELAENEKLKKDIHRLESSARRTSKWSDDIEKTKKGTKVAGLKPDKGYIGHQSAKMMQRSKNMEFRQQNAIEEKKKLLKNIERADTLKIKPLTYHTNLLTQLSQVSISYGDRTICRDVTFSISRGERIALYGPNGCGKSSILKLICGENLAYDGELKKGSQLKLSYVEQDTAGMQGGLAEYARLYGIDQSLFRAILAKLDFSKVQFEKDISEYSAGQKKKVLLARSLCEQAHLYIWDEPLNYVDVLSRMQIEELLLAYQPTILFVEHDRAFCENIATRIVQL